MDRATERFHDTIESLLLGKPIPRPSLDKQDVIDSLNRDTQEIIANGLCSTFRFVVNGALGKVTWAPDERSYACEAGDEQTARLCGYKAFSEEHENELNEVIFWGVRPTSRGTYVAQFEVVRRDS